LHAAQSQWFLHIVLRYTFIQMKHAVSDSEYRALAELRYRIRHFIQEGDAAAQRSNLQPQQYLMLLAIRGLPESAVATIRTLAERMALKHHSAVELIDRLESHGLVRRSRGQGDKREVRVSLLPQGSKLLDRVARERLSELRASGAALADAITALVKRKLPSPRVAEINETTDVRRRPGISRSATLRKQNNKPMPCGRKRRA
jgi:DNA-binding MarR family transcriptional regulator